MGRTRYDRYKIALCFSGRPKNIELAWPSIEEHLISPLMSFGNRIDVFYHFWNIKGMRDKHIRELLQPQFSGSEEDMGGVLAPRFEEEFSRKHPEEYERAQLLPVTAHHIMMAERQPGRLKGKVFKLWSPNVYPMFLSIKLCQIFMEQWAKENRVNYDFVFRLRPDMVLISPVGRLTFKGLDNSGTLYLPKDKRGREGYRNAYIKDHFAMGSPTVMHRYAATYDNLEALTLRHLQPDLIHQTLCQESALGIQFQQQAKSWSYPINYLIARRYVKAYRGDDKLIVNGPMYDKLGEIIKKRPESYWTY